MATQGSLSLGSIAYHMKNGENLFYLYTRGKEEYEELIIEPVSQLTDTDMWTPRTINVLVNDVQMTLAEIYDRNYKKGHFFFFRHHLDDYILGRP